MSVESNKSLVRSVLESLHRNLRGTAELFTPDFVRHLPNGMENRGREAFLDAEAAVIEAMGKAKITILDVFGDGDRVAVRIRTEGTHSGFLLGLPPTGKPFSTSAIGIFRIENDKIAEAWEELDIGGWMAQLQQ